MNDGDRRPSKDSNWDDMISPDGEVRVRSRGAFFDGHVEGVRKMVSLKSDYIPWKKSLHAIQSALAEFSPLASRVRSSRREYVQSDADDEDDEERRKNDRSPIRDRKMEKIRFTIQEGFKTSRRQVYDNA